MTIATDKRYKLLMDILLEAIARREPITYKDVTDAASEIDKKMERDMYFHGPLRNLLGSLNDAIFELNKRLPAISSIVIMKNGKNKGLPGVGIEGFSGFRNWEKADLQRKREMTSIAQEKIFAYKYWLEIYQELFKTNPRRLGGIVDYRERDGNTLKGVGGHGGESDEHLNLKEYVAKHPKLLGIRDNAQFEKEFSLPSGDRVDVAFVRNNGITLIEVKSRISSDDDLRRGIYQCVKYRGVYCAWRCDLLDISKRETQKFARAVLVTERALSQKLDDLAKTLKVDHLQIKLPKV